MIKYSDLCLYAATDIIDSELDSYLFCLEVIRYKLPVDQTIEGLDVLDSGVSIVDVVGVFPDVDGQQGLVALADGVFCVGSVDDVQFLVLLDQPSPPRAEVAHGLGCEMLQEVIDTGPFGFYLFEELSFRSGLVGSDAVPEKRMIPVLESVVEYLLIVASDYEQSYFVMMSSRDLPSHSVPFMRLFKLVT